MEDEVVRIILQVKGQEEIKNLKQYVEEARDKLALLLKTEDEFSDRTQRAARMVGMWEKDLKDAEAELVRLKTATDAAAGSEGPGFGMGNLAHMAVHSQTRIASFGRDIERLALSMGAGAGLAGTLGALSYVLIEFGGKLIESMRTTPVDELMSSIDQLKTKITELEENPHKLTVDLYGLEEAKSHLKELEAGAHAYQAALQGKSEAEVRSGTAVKKLFAESLLPGEQEKIVTDTKAVFMQDVLANDMPLKEAQAKLDKLRADSEQLEKNVKEGRWTGTGENIAAERATYLQMIGRAGEDVTKRQFALTKDAETQAGEVWGGAEKGDTTQNERLAKLLERSGHGGLGAGVRERTPMNMDEIDDEEKSAKLAESTGKQASATQRAKRAVMAKETRDAKQEEKKDAKDRMDQAALELKTQADIDKENAKTDDDLAKMHQKDREEMGRTGAEFGRAKGLKNQIEQALNQGQDEGAVSGQIGRTMEAQGIVPQGQGFWAGSGAVKEAKDDLTKKMLNLQSQGFNALESRTLIQDELVNEFMQLGDKVQRIELMLNRQQQNLNIHRDTRMSRVR